MTTWIEWTDNEHGNLGLQSERIDRWLKDNPDYRERFKYWLHQFKGEFHVWAEVELWAYWRMKGEATQCPNASTFPSWTTLMMLGLPCGNVLSSAPTVKDYSKGIRHTAKVRVGLMFGGRR